MRGPVFEGSRGFAADEWIVYTCAVCGYRAKERPLDHYTQKAKEPGIHKPGSQVPLSRK